MKNVQEVLKTLRTNHTNNSYLVNAISKLKIINLNVARILRTNAGYELYKENYPKVKLLNYLTKTVLESKDKTKISYDEFEEILHRLNSRIVPVQIFSATLYDGKKTVGKLKRQLRSAYKTYLENPCMFNKLIEILTSNDLILLDDTYTVFLDRGYKNLIESNVSLRSKIKSMLSDVNKAVVIKTVANTYCKYSVKYFIDRVLNKPLSVRTDLQERFKKIIDKIDEINKEVPELEKTHKIILNNSTKKHIMKLIGKYYRTKVFTEKVQHMYNGIYSKKTVYNKLNDIKDNIEIRNEDKFLDAFEYTDEIRKLYITSLVLDKHNLKHLERFHFMDGYVSKLDKKIKEGEIK